LAQNKILETKDLGINFGGLKAVDRVSFVLKEGEIRSVIGPNGAGKTTFFNLLCGSLRPTRGEIWFQGENIVGQPQYKICRKGLVKSHQITSIFPALSVYENIRLAAQMKVTHFNCWKKLQNLKSVNDKTMEILNEIGLTKKKEIVASSLPYGDQRYLEIGITLATDPILLLLDEPTAGMTPAETRETMKLIQKLSKRLTIVIVEHDMSVVMGISDYITVLHNGLVLAEGTPSEITNNEEVKRVYLGGH
jgi:branched-chain amino acid transport system ATP-binding protein